VSLIKQVDVSCDECNTTLDDAAWTGEEARRYALDAGWRVGLPGGRDECPDCRPGGDPQAVETGP
jgi:hypothetical protein